MKIIKHLFPDGCIVNSLKSFVGHTLGASAILEIALCLGMLKNGFIYQPENLGTPMDLNYVISKTLQKKVKYFLKNSFGFGGNNVSLVIKML
jgi:3-oxoacyl-(acyl-carrier-protein) synthase